MIRVLQVLGGTNLGGAESRIMDIYRHIDRDRIQFDFLITEGNSGFYTPQIEELGGHVYTVPPYRVINHGKYKAAVKAFFEEHKGYAAVHGHMTSTASIYLPIAKKSGVGLTIAHARSAGVDSGPKGKVTNFLRKHLPEKCDKMIACSDLAAKSVFGENNYNDGKVKVMPNAIDVEEFTFDSDKRNEIRARYNVSDKFLVGHVGRFHEAKNHKFIVDTFAKFLEYREDAVLMLVGDGPLKQNVLAWIEEADKANIAAGKPSVKDKIILTGNQSPVAPFYHAFDLFFFPSVFEGMPGTVVEAQASGLHSVISDAITRMVKVSDLVEFYSLEQTVNEWAKKLYSVVGDIPVDKLTEDRAYMCRSIVDSMKETEFNVEKQIEYYVSLYEGGATELN